VSNGDVSKLGKEDLFFLIKDKKLISDKISSIMQDYLSRKIQKNEFQKYLPHEFSEASSHPNLKKYQEVSSQIRKVTYNTDYFNKHNFEQRMGPSFHFNSGRIGKFIECEFSVPLCISRSCLIMNSGHPVANITFVIQASVQRLRWDTIAAFR